MLGTFFSPTKGKEPVAQKSQLDIPLIEIDKASETQSATPSNIPSHHSQFKGHFQGSMYGSAFEEPIDEDLILKARRLAFDTKLAERELYEKQQFQASLKARRELERQEWESREEYLRKFPQGQMPETLSKPSNPQDPRVAGQTTDEHIAWTDEQIRLHQAQQTRVKNPQDLPSKDLSHLGAAALSAEEYSKLSVEEAVKNEKLIISVRKSLGHLKGAVKKLATMS